MSTVRAIGYDHVVWFDPGKMTGIASYALRGGVHYSTQLDHQATGDWLERSFAVVAGQRVAVGWEMFLKPRGSAGTSSFSHETIGMIRYLATKHGAEILKPMPSSARKLGSDTKLRAIGWYHPGKRHANDASNHCLAYLMREDMLPVNLRAKLFTADTTTDKVDPASRGEAGRESGRRT